MSLHDAEDVRPRKLSERARKEQAVNDWQWVMRDPRGRRVLAHILASTGLFDAAYVPGDALATAFREGARSVGIVTNRALTTTDQAAARAILVELLTPDVEDRAG